MAEGKTEQRFSVKRVLISRGYSNDTPFTAEISVESAYGNEVKVKLPEDRVLKLIEHVDDMVVEALSLQFTGMKEDHIAAIKEREAKQLEAPIDSA